MSMNIALKDAKGVPAGDRAAPARGAAASGVWPTVRRVLMPLASLKFTVVLFAMAIFLVFTGTLVQKQIDIWEVINDWFRIDDRELLTEDFPWFNFGQLFVRIPLDIFCIDLFWTNPPKDVTWGLWFPRGWLIGLLMGINLIAAHTVRFTVQARGMRLWGGLAVIAAGCVVTWAVIESGSSESGILRGSLLEWGTLWKLLLMGLATLAFVCAVTAIQLERRRVFERVAAGIGAVVGFGVLIFALYYSAKAKEMLIGPESMRILWQLIKGTVAGLVLLIGCWMVFKKRAGIVLLHGGIGLLFLYEVVVGTSHDEAQMVIMEGGDSNWVQDSRSPELAVVTRDGENDRVTIVPKRLLKEATYISHPDLPFDISIPKGRYFKNCDVVDKGPMQPSIATRGAGLKKTIIPLAPTTGATAGSGVDHPGMYATLIDKKNGGELGTFLLSVGYARRQSTGTFDGKERFIEMRFERTQKPYTISALEVRADQYVASNKFRNYSSKVRVVDHQRHLDQEELIKMNNPMRFAGETFYQSNYQEIEGRKFTTLSVVKNSGWMLPYVSCMIVGVGMLAQFGVSLMRFLGRRRETEQLAPATVVEKPIERAKKSKQRKGGRGEDVAQGRNRSAGDLADANDAEARKPWPTWVLPAATCAVVAAFVAYAAKPMKPDERGMDLAAFGRLPMAGDARVKPFEAQARSTLSFLSHKQTYKYDALDSKEKSKPAIRWLLDLITGSPNAARAKIFRIENDGVIKTLGLPEKAGLVFSYNQIMEKMHDARTTEYEFQVRLAEQRARLGKPEPYDRELVELHRRVNEFRDVSSAFQDVPALMNFNPELKSSASPEDRKAHERQVIRCAEQLLMIVRHFQDDQKPPLAVPVTAVDWRSMAEFSMRGYLTDPSRRAEVAEILGNIDTFFESFRKMVTPAASMQAKREFVQIERAVKWLHAVTDGRDKELPLDLPAATKLAAVFQAYRANQGAEFNAAVTDYQQFLNQHPPAEYDVARTRWEAFLLHWEPFSWCSWIYVVALVIALGSWLKYRETLGTVAFWMIVATFVLQTSALILRIYVTKRPPVTNLYSSAVFIGWGAVLTGIVLERVYRLGVGNIVAAVAGYGSLQIAHILARQGDTIGSLEAVLDTQFWLTTHVVCITLGYMATYAAGILGIIYVVLGVVTPSLTKELAKDIARMVYGTLCFALFLSFVGTVLGGLWADDSWGRFWGWDPKENGALIIVLWNALVLHARWDGIVKDRGLAILAVGGNITTSWSWFGVNQLGVGLHSYGFSQELMNLMTSIVVVSVITIVVGMLPKDYWMSGKHLAKTA